MYRTTRSWGTFRGTNPVHRATHVKRCLQGLPPFIHKHVCVSIAFALQSDKGPCMTPWGPVWVWRPAGVRCIFTMLNAALSSERHPCESQ